MITGSQIRRCIYAVCPHLSSLPDRFKCNTINGGTEMRIVLYAATDINTGDDAQEKFDQGGTIHNDDNIQKIMDELESVLGVVATSEVVKSTEKYNGSEILTFSFEVI